MEETLQRGAVAAEAEKSEWFSPAASGEGEIYSRLWAPSSPPLAVVQIAHGMSEYIGRYDDFAVYLARRGFAVCGNDHAGHGRSARVKGYFAAKDGWECLLRDMKRLEDQMRQKHPGLPVFLFGHSMGSFLARSYITRTPGLAGCILCGTAGSNPALLLGRAIAAVQKRAKGPQSVGRLLARLSFGGYNSRIKNPVNDFAWLTAGEDVPRAYAQDDLCGFPFTASGYAELFRGLTEVTSPRWAAKVPKELPVFLIAGEDDPVGAYGKGPREVRDALHATGHADAQLRLYPGMRHEILNEADKRNVYEYILAWMLARMKAQRLPEGK